MPTTPPPRSPRIHPTAVVDEGARVGRGVLLWHFTHVRTGAVIGAGSQLGMGVYVDHDAVIGRRCHVQNFVSIFTGVQIEDDVFIGPSAVFTNDRFPRAHNVRWQPASTRVCSGASIGANATILCGITIGQYAMIGAGAVVTSDVPPHALVVGAPARQIGWVCACGARTMTPPPHACTHG